MAKIIVNIADVIDYNGKINVNNGNVIDYNGKIISNNDYGDEIDITSLDEITALLACLNRADLK